MRSRTSFFNKQLYRKNLTRFAPVFLLYILCLFMGLLIMYQDDRDMARSFWFASRVAESIQVMVAVNLLFGPLIAMLLFGDLFNSRLCMGLHAMPVRRETIFVTGVLSGLTFSLVPTGLMTLACIPLLNATCVVNAWAIALWWFLSANLQFLTFFGIAVFCVFLTGNRAAMLAIYALLNCGAYLIYAALNAVYVPMLYGVVLTETIPNLLTPCAMTGLSLVEVENYNALLQRFPDKNFVAAFQIHGANVARLAVWAAVGLLLLGASLLLYRRRHLECAGDAVAVRVLHPVFQVCCSVSAAVLSVLAMTMFFGYQISSRPGISYLFLAFGLAVGWFGGRMFLARSTRVFGGKSFLGFGILAAVLALSIAATKFDILGIDDWRPQPEKLQSVCIVSGGYSLEVTDEPEMQQLLTLQELALEDRVRDTGSYPRSYIESSPEGLRNVEIPGEGFFYGEGGYDMDEEHLRADTVTLAFTMKSGRTVVRRYPVWISLEEGDIIREFLSRWEAVWEHANFGDTPFDPNHALQILFESMNKETERSLSPQDAASLMEAIRLDCDERTMMQRGNFHNGYFTLEDGTKRQCIYFSLWDTTTGAAQLAVYPDSRHTLQWISDHGYEFCEEVNTTYSGVNFG